MLHLRLKVYLSLTVALAGVTVGSTAAEADVAALEKDNPLKPIPKSPLGIDQQLKDLKDPPTPARVRLGRWLFFDKRLSADNTIACASCHKPEHGFSELTPNSTGIKGQKGGRKAPSLLNQAWTIFPHFFWDGRAKSLEDQAKGPITNPIEMGMKDHDVAVKKVAAIAGYGPYFKEAFGDEKVTIDRMAKAIADYERTRLSGNSAWDKWQRKRDENAVTAEVKLGHKIFFGKAQCNQCHLGQNFTDSRFHNIGVGWDANSERFADEGRYAISKKKEDMGAFKTPSLRDVTKRAPYMHDGSHKTLRDTVVIYNKGGIKNPTLSPKVKELKLTEKEIDALVAFMKALDGEGYMDTEPKAFPK